MILCASAPPWFKSDRRLLAHDPNEGVARTSGMRVRYFFMAVGVAVFVSACMAGFVANSGAYLP